MSEPLMQLVYVSFATHKFSEAELEQLLDSIRVNNQRLGVTGMLLYRNGDFIQVLEGAETTITQLYQTILDDPRHSGMFELLSQPITEREFGDWSMGFKRIGSDNLPGYSKLMNNPNNPELRAETASQALSLMRIFASGQL